MICVIHVSTNSVNKQIHTISTKQPAYRMFCHFKYTLFRIVFCEKHMLF